MLGHGEKRVTAKNTKATKKGLTRRRGGAKRKSPSPACGRGAGERVWILRLRFVSRRMTKPDACQPHPHPNLPLEGEGTRVLCRFAASREAKMSRFASLMILCLRVKWGFF